MTGHGGSEAGPARESGDGTRGYLDSDISAAIDFMQSRPQSITFSTKVRAPELPFRSGVAVLGHSMGGGAVLEAGINDERVIAVIGMAAAHGDGDLDSTNPPNLLLAVGTEDDLVSPSESLALLRSATGDEEAVAGVLYGDFSDGTARQMLLSPGSGHVEEAWVTVIISASINWIENAMGLEPSEYEPGPLQTSVTCMYVSIVGLLVLLFCIPVVSVWAADRLLELPRRPALPVVRRPSWKGGVVYLLTGLAGGLLGLPLGYAHMGFFIALGGFIIAMFLTWGVFALIVVLVLRRRWNLPALRVLMGDRQATGFGVAAALVAFVAVYIIFLITLGTGFVDTTPTPFRWVLIAVFTAAFFPLTLVDGWLLWGVAVVKPRHGSMRFALHGALLYLVTKLAIILVGMLVVGTLFFFAGAFLLAIVILQAVVGSILYARAPTLVAFAAFNAMWLAYVVAGLLPFMTF